MSSTDAGEPIGESTKAAEERKEKGESTKATKERKGRSDDRRGLGRSPRGSAQSTRPEAKEPDDLRVLRGSRKSPARLATLDDVIADALAKHERLSAYIEEHAADLDPEQLARLLALHGQNASRLGRLLRDKRALSGKAADGLLDALGKALDELSTELGVKL